METGFDDSGWEEAKPYTFFETKKPVAPFHMKNRTIPPMEHQKSRFCETVCIRDASAGTKELLMEQWNQMLHGQAEVEIPAHTTQIVELSAGEEMCGYPMLGVSGGRDAKIEILYSECYGIPQPDMITPVGKRPLPPIKGDRTDHRSGRLQGPVDQYHVTRYGTKEKPEVYVPFLFRTFRYIQIKVTTMEQGLSILKNLMEAMPKEQQESMRVKDSVCRGHVGDQVFLEYFGRRCCGMTTWTLPEDHTYRIEVIDIWEMTRKVVYTGVKGKIEPALPGKEGIALMAVAE
ncbi:MAG: DUF5605 domain-containing protein [Eubacteriales bacterium]|nr:DUF5605 domain-containing protein [Eubacteriales bacterium]